MRNRRRDCRGRSDLDVGNLVATRSMSSARMAPGVVGVGSPRLMMGSSGLPYAPGGRTRLGEVRAGQMAHAGLSRTPLRHRVRGVAWVSRPASCYGGSVAYLALKAIGITRTASFSFITYL